MTDSIQRSCALLVDDNLAVRRALGMLMKSLGWDIVDASHAEQALLELEHRQFELAIIDLKMPGTDGIELIRLMQLRPDLKVPVLFIHSGYVNNESRAELTQIGVQAILEKPMSRTDLIAALKHHGLFCPA